MPAVPDLADRIAPTLARVRPRGAGIAVGAWDGSEQFAWAAGELPAGPDSLFEIGSITKLFTATLLVDMAREGVVRLDQPVAELLPGGLMPPARGRAITLEDLSCHGSGLPRLPKGTAWTGLVTERRDPYALIGAARLEAAIGRTKPKRAPGERWVYSNYGAGLLGYALARRAGVSYDELVRSRICAPLGLERHRLRTSTAGASHAGTRGSAAPSRTGTSMRWPGPARFARPCPTCLRSCACTAASRPARSPAPRRRCAARGCAREAWASGSAG